MASLDAPRTSPTSHRLRPSGSRQTSLFFVTAPPSNLGDSRILPYQQSSPVCLRPWGLSHLPLPLIPSHTGLRVAAPQLANCNYTGRRGEELDLHAPLHQNCSMWHCNTCLADSPLGAGGQSSTHRPDIYLDGCGTHLSFLSSSSLRSEPSGARPLASMSPPPLDLPSPAILPRFLA